MSVCVFFLGRHTFCVCVRSNLFLWPMCVCVCETSFFMCRDSLWSPLPVFALNCCFTYSSLWPALFFVPGSKVESV